MLGACMVQIYASNNFFMGYCTILLIPTLYSIIWWWDYKLLKGNRHGLIQTISNYLHGETEEYLDPPSLIRVAGVLAKIRTKNLINMSLDHYHYTQLVWLQNQETCILLKQQSGLQCEQRSVHSETVL